MATSTRSEKTNVEYVPGVGWMLKPYQASIGNTQELTAAQPGIYQLAAWSAPATADEYNGFAQLALTGVTYGAGVQASGSPFITQRVAASESFATRNSADETAYPPPNTSEDTEPMDRWLTLLTNHEPSDRLFFRFYVPGGGLSSSGPLLTVYFCGPAGSVGALVGNGQYALKLGGSGMATLWELCSGTWIFRHIFQWCEASHVYNAHHSLQIATNARDFPPYAGNTIAFIPASVSALNPVAAAAMLAASAIRIQQARNLGFVYTVPRQTAEPVSLAPLRVDKRRSVRLSFQASKATYPASGVLFDDIVSLPYYPDTSERITLEWWGFVPTGCSLLAQLFDAESGAVLSSEVTVVTDALGGIRTYVPNLIKRSFRVKVTFLADATATKSPRLTKVRIYRNSVFETPTVTETTIPSRGTAPALAKVDVENLRIQGVTADSSIETATFDIVDYTGELNLEDQAGQPVAIYTKYENSANTVCLFRGYVDTAIGEPLSGDGEHESLTSFASRRYTVTAFSEQVRLNEALCPDRFAWTNEETGQLYKVTSIIRRLLRTAYADTEINIPDIDIRLFGTGSEGFVCEPGARVGEIAAGLARDYLGAFLIWDPSAGTSGQWRLLQQKAPPYNYLVRFDTRHPGAGKIAHVELAYGTSTGADFPSQTVKHTFIQRGTLNTRRERAEGNTVIVYGGAGGDDAASAGSDGARLSQVAVNVNSYNALNLDPSDPAYPDENHADYIGRRVPIYYVDVTLGTQQAVDWVCRRVYDVACHSRLHLTFTAPLTLVTDSEDADQLRPRPLRFYDIVQVYWEGSWQNFIVLSCTPSYTKDTVQMAEYHVVRPSNLDDEKAAVVAPMTPRDILQTISRASSGARATPGMLWVANRQTNASFSDVMALPEPLPGQIQDLDSTSPDFGAFYFDPDYDPIL